MYAFVIEEQSQQGYHWKPEIRELEQSQQGYHWELKPDSMVPTSNCNQRSKKESSLNKVPSGDQNMRGQSQ